MQEELTLCLKSKQQMTLIGFEPTSSPQIDFESVAEFKSFVMNNNAFGNKFCNSQKEFSQISEMFRPEY